MTERVWGFSAGFRIPANRRRTTIPGACARPAADVGFSLAPGHWGGAPSGGGEWGCDDAVARVHTGHWGDLSEELPPLGSHSSFLSSEGSGSRTEQIWIQLL